MSRTDAGSSSNGFHWWIRRNPLYLLSAAAMALGARWLLVHPDSAAGDAGLILATLGVLQLYECTVSAVLIMLHRHRRSPEDLPSLLLVGALFWTGPLAATVEMTARHGTVGLGFAAAASVIALGEMRVIRRSLGLVFSPWSQFFASTCILLLCAAPWSLSLPSPREGTDGAALYSCWWIFGGILLAGLGGLSRHVRREREKVESDPTRRARRFEMIFLVLIALATAVHLWGMNYAFYGHARLFYVTPVLAALTVVCFEHLIRRGSRHSAAWLAGALAPLLGVMLSSEGFHSKVGTASWPLLFRDPVLTALALASVAWSYGASRRGPTWLIHFGALGIALSIGRIASGTTGSIEAGVIARAFERIPRDTLAALSFSGMAYLLLIAWWRRSRWEVLGALPLSWLGVHFWVHDRFAADAMTSTLLLGWEALVAIHIIARRPALAVRLLPLLLVLSVNGHYLREPELKYFAMTHAAALTVGLFVCGWMWPWTHYRATAICFAGVWLAAGTGRWIFGHPHAKAILAIGAAFGLMFAGAWISWHKTRWTGESEIADAAVDAERDPQSA